MEFKKHLEFYCAEYFKTYTPLAEDEFNDKVKAQIFMEKYWLPEYEYQKIWKPRQNHIFINQEKNIEVMLFNSEYEIFVINGGALLSKQDYEELQICMKAIGDEYFVIVQNNVGKNDSYIEPLFRMKFPVSISWEELMSGSYISSALFYYSHNSFFVFGENLNWGKYSANELGIDIIGTTKKNIKLFKDNLTITEQEKEWLRKQFDIPAFYKKYI